MSLTLAILGGFLPAIFWLWFWLHEDRKSPEPKSVIIESFLAGGLAVIPTYFLERYLRDQLGFNIETNPLITITLWAAIEEGLKFIAVYLTALRRRYFDEPVDAMVYMITGALGFVAVENSLFIFNAILEHGLTDFNYLLTGNLRFIGATLTHTVTSALIGGIIALAFWTPRWLKELALLGGLILATLLHALFNYSILNSGDVSIWKIFVGLWLATILIILFFERIKVVSPKSKA